MRFLDTLKTKLFGDQNNRGDHGFRAGFVPFLAPSLVAIGASTIGAPAALVAGTLVPVGAAVIGVGAAVIGTGLALMVAKDEKRDGYNVKRFLVGAGAGCVAGAALVFNVVSGHLLQEQPNAPVAEPVPSTLEIKLSAGSLCKNFNVAETTDAQERTVYTLTVPKGCTVPAAASAVPR